MLKQQTKRRWIMFCILALASITFTGCEKGSLGIKGGTATGHVLNSANNQPIAEVLIRATAVHPAGNTLTQTVYTGGDGSYFLQNLTQGSWSIFAEKYGFSSDTESPEAPAATFYVNTGESVMVPVVKMTKTQELYKGVLKGYPIDAITGRPVRNFTVTQTEPFSQRKSKLFETAEDFRDSGWTGLEGGEHQYTITANNYHEYIIGGENSVVIGASPVDLGVITMDPHRVNVAGTLRNLPGHVLDAADSIYMWAEAAGKLVASFTSNGEGLQGSFHYTLKDLPVTAGSVAVKTKIRGYDLATINPAVSISQTMPGGTIAGIDADFSNIEPIRRDLRVIVNSTAPSDDDPGSFPPGEVARVYIKQGGKDIVPYVDVMSKNYKAEAYFTGISTAYTIDIIVVNQDRGYYTSMLDGVIVAEDGNTIFTVTIQLQ